MSNFVDTITSENVASAIGTRHASSERALPRNVVERGNHLGSLVDVGLYGFRCV
jgi:hypothetical protein